MSVEEHELTEKLIKSNQETRKHIHAVRRYLLRVQEELSRRARDHDKTKLEEPEASFFAEVTEKLAGLEYGSEEYQQGLEDLKPALGHHYAKNRHHPQHFPDGIAGMNLIDVIEMFCDWKASSERHNSGNLLKSIEHNATRFHLPPALVSIFKNTVDLFENTNE